MLGGSPMRVAVPPMFEARTWLMRYGIGETPSLRATDSVTGVMSNTVVTLSRKAETPAVTRHRMMSRRRGSPRDMRTECTASHWKKPVLARALASTIIPANRKMTLRSMAAKAVSWSMTPRTIRSSPAKSATSVRSRRSEAMRA